MIDALTVLVYQEVKLPGSQREEFVGGQPQMQTVGPALIPQLLIRQSAGGASSAPIGSFFFSGIDKR